MNQRNLVTLALWVAAAVVFLAALAGANPWIVLLVGVIVVLVAGLLVRRKIRRWLAYLARGSRPDRFWIPPAWLYGLAVLTAAWFLLVDLDDWFVAPVVGLLLALLTFLSGRLPGYAKARSPYVAHIPGAPERKLKQPRKLYLMTPLGVVGTALVLGVMRLAGVFAEASVVLLVIVVLAYLLLFFSTRAYAKNCARINHALSSYEPTCVLPHDGRALFHLEMWTPYFVNSKLPFIQLATQYETFVARAEESDLPIVHPDELTVGGLRRAMPDSLRAAFYPRNGPINMDFIDARPDITHVFLHHGDGDKAASSNVRSAQYDVLVVAGQAAIDRYAMRGIEIPRHKFVILGRPQVADILEPEEGIAAKEPVTALYAPTWRGIKEIVNYSSLTLGPDIVQALIDRRVRVIFRPHAAGQKHKPHAKAIQRIKDLLEKDREATGLEHAWGENAESPVSFVDVANQSDLMIADVSGVITDYMQSGKPLVMVSMKMDARAFRSQYPSSNSAYIIEAAESESINAALDEALGEDSLRDFRLERRKHYLGGYVGNGSPEAFIHYIRDLSGAI